VTRIRRLDTDPLWDDENSVGITSRMLTFLRPVRVDALRVMQELVERLGVGLTARQVELLEGGDSLANHYLQRPTTLLVYEALALLLALEGEGRSRWRRGSLMCCSRSWRVKRQAKGLSSAE
jgi:hypothetical protein